ncbi:MAG TPA: DsbA family protein [Chthoniobacterales bacterium]|jgi:protein-disulfide isomerase
MKRYLPFLIVALVAVLTATGGTLLYRAKRQTLAAVIPKDRPPAEEGDGEHTLGPADAIVTLEEYGDFQCPPCGALSEPLNQMVHEVPKMRIIFRHFPLVMHRNAHDAAMAAEAAGLQGHFWQMHDLLYREQSVWSKALDVRELFEGYAASIKCNVARFKRDVISDEVSARVQADQDEGTKLGVKNTPTIFVNYKPMPPGSLNPTDLRAAVNEAMKAGKPPAIK